MKRLDNWPTLLAAYFKSMVGVPFELGKNDCGRFACGAVMAVTGEDIVQQLGSYTDAAGEEASLLELAGKLNLPRISVKKAQRGDVALYSGPHGRCLLVVDGIYAIGPGENGPVLVPVLKCLEAWKIG